MVSPLTERHRRQQLAVRASTVRDLTRLWPALNWRDLDRTYPAFALSVAGLVRDRRVVSSQLAAAYVRAFRSAAGVPGEVQPIVAAALEPERLAVALHATSVARIKASAARGETAQKAMRAGFVAAAGAVSRMVLDAGRDTVRLTLSADSDAVGWRRVTGGNSCGFCRMLAGRGAVYAEETAGFQSHDHCGCAAEPVYETA